MVHASVWSMGGAKVKLTTATNGPDHRWYTEQVSSFCKSEVLTKNRPHGQAQLHRQMN